MKDGENIPTSRSKQLSNRKWDKENYDQILVRFPKGTRELIKLTNTSSINGYIKDAVYDKLNNDGIKYSMLGEQVAQKQEVSQQPKQYMIYMVTSWNATPEEYKAIQCGAELAFEEYVSTFQTLIMAKNYIKRKYTKKAHPEEWYYTIYGRYIEADNKLDALDKYRKMAQDAVKEENDGVGNEDGWYDFLTILNRYRKPDYVEVVKYENIIKENADVE